VRSHSARFCAGFIPLKNIPELKISKTEFITTDPSFDQQARTTVYTAQNDEHELAVRIDDRRCRDSMSGEAFETTVTVILDARKYQGCGKALH
jgi:putative lipoprotein